MFFFIFLFSLNTSLLSLFWRSKWWQVSLALFGFLGLEGTETSKERRIHGRYISRLRSWQVFGGGILMQFIYCKGTRRSMTRCFSFIIKKFYSDRKRKRKKKNLIKQKPSWIYQTINQSTKTFRAGQCHLDASDNGNHFTRDHTQKHHGDCTRLWLSGRS